MSPVEALGWGAAIRILRWLPMIAGLVALDQIGGTKGLAIGVVAAIDAAALSVTAHKWLTGRADRPVPEPSWLEALLVWLSITLLLTLQVAFGGAGGTAGRIAAVLCGLALGSLASEAAATRAPRPRPTSSAGPKFG
jgi:hypothetical protein